MILGLGAATVAVSQQTTILGERKEFQPTYGSIENLTILAYTDIDGWDEAAEFRVSKDGKTAYISNYKGFSILDVSDPTKPVILSRTSNHPSVQSQYIDVLDDLLVVNQEGVRDEKVKLLKSIRPVRDVSKQVVRGQYFAGMVDGKLRNGYRQEEKVKTDSNVETYLALKLFIDNWRWSGVPFFLRTGKRMTETSLEAVVEFKQPPRMLFKPVEGHAPVPNVLRFRLSAVANSNAT